MQRKRLLFTEILGKRPWLWCNTCNLPNLEVGLVFKQVVTTAKAPSSFLTLEKLAMKKTLIALAVLAASGAAMAQSTVTISGVLAYGWQNSGGTKGTTRTDGNVNFSAVEDLGGGLKATATAGIDLANRGQFAAGRNWTLGLSGDFGSLSMGTANANLSSRLGDAGGTIALDKNIDDIYGSDVNLQVVNYTAPKFGNLTVGITWNGAAGSALSDTAAAVAPGKITSASGDIAASYAIDGGNVVLTYRPEDRRVRYGVNYTLSGVSFGAHMVPEYTAYSTGSVVAAQTEFEAWMPLGALTIGAQTGKRDTAKGTTFGAKYALSKRTSVTASFGKINTGSQTSAAATQQRIKLQHSF
jgi:Gram-negative porin